MTTPETSGRENEWFALKRGPRRVRAAINMLFIPYTVMNASYVVIGSMLSSAVRWDRAAALVAVYLLAVGVSAHALDAMGPNKPWGTALTNRQLTFLAGASLGPALAVGGYYAVAYAPWLLAVGVVELFFLFAYNLNLFDSRFHSDGWFAFSWGFLPVVSGYVAQTNGISLAVLAAAIFALATSYLEITASRPYKALRMAPGAPVEQIRSFERILQAVVVCTVAVAAALLLLRAIG